MTALLPAVTHSLVPRHIRDAYELYVGTMGRPRFILQHVDAYAPQTATRDTKNYLATSVANHQMPGTSRL